MKYCKLHELCKDVIDCPHSTGQCQAICNILALRTYVWVKELIPKSYNSCNLLNTYRNYNGGSLG